MNKQEIIEYYYQELYEYINKLLPGLTFSGTIYLLDFLSKIISRLILEMEDTELDIYEILSLDFASYYEDIKDIVFKMENNVNYFNLKNSLTEFTLIEDILLGSLNSLYIFLNFTDNKKFCSSYQGVEEFMENLDNKKLLNENIKIIEREIVNLLNNDPFFKKIFISNFLVLFFIHLEEDIDINNLMIFYLKILSKNFNYPEKNKLNNEIIKNKWNLFNLNKFIKNLFEKNLKIRFSTIKKNNTYETSISSLFLNVFANELRNFFNKTILLPEFQFNKNIRNNIHMISTYIDNNHITNYYSKNKIIFEIDYLLNFEMLKKEKPHNFNYWLKFFSLIIKFNQEIPFFSQMNLYSLLKLNTEFVFKIYLDNEYENLLFNSLLDKNKKGELNNQNKEENNNNEDNEDDDIDLLDDEDDIDLLDDEWDEEVEKLDNKKILINEWLKLIKIVNNNKIYFLNDKEQNFKFLFQVIHNEENTMLKNEPETFNFQYYNINIIKNIAKKTKKNRNCYYYLTQFLLNNFHNKYTFSLNDIKVLTASCQKLKQENFNLEKNFDLHNAINILSNFSNIDVNSNKKEVVENVNSFLKKLKKINRNSKKIIDEHSNKNIINYDIKLINTNIDIEELINNIKKEPYNIKFLFYGIPGTGKTELAKYIANKLGLNLNIYYASDIFQKYSGETEKTIKAIFENNIPGKDIILIDEIDSILLNREQSTASWEKRDTNEFLTRIENYKGILIGTTNFINNIDKAALRRFDLKIEFNPLTKKQIKIVLNKTISKLKLNKDNEYYKKIINLNNLTMGDFAVIIKQSRFIKIKNLEDLYNRLYNEIKFKNIENDDKKIKIGFCH